MASLHTLVLIAVNQAVTTQCSEPIACAADQISAVQTAYMDSGEMSKQLVPEGQQLRSLHAMMQVAWGKCLRPTSKPAFPPLAPSTPSEPRPVPPRCRPFFTPFSPKAPPPTRYPTAAA